MTKDKLDEYEIMYLKGLVLTHTVLWIILLCVMVAFLIFAMIVGMNMIIF